MNLNPVMIEVGREMGYPCKLDLYEGTESKFIVYSYADERASYYGDDDEEEIQVTLQVQLITPQNYNYFSDKTKLKRTLKEKGFCVENIQSFLDDEAVGTDRARRTVFTCNYTGADN